MKLELSNISRLCSDLAADVSPTGRWPDTRTPQTVSYKRGGYIGTDNIDVLSVEFEARRLAHDDIPSRFPKVSYILRLVASKELVYEELPEMARATITMAEVSASTSTMIIATESMLEEENFGEFEDDMADNDYTYERYIQYVLDRKGRIAQYSEGQGYRVNGEEMTQIAYVQTEGQNFWFESGKREEKIIGQHVIVTEEGIDVTDVPKVLKETHPIHDIRYDLAFADFVAEYGSEMGITGQSIREHRARMMAMVSFLTLKGNAQDLIKTAFA